MYEETVGYRISYNDDLRYLHRHLLLLGLSRDEGRDFKISECLNNKKKYIKIFG
jgi:hypothetical protein